MKTLLLSIFLSLGLIMSQAQVIDTLMVIKKEEEAPRIEREQPDEVIVNTGKSNDTTVITINKKRIVIVDDGEDKQVKWETDDADEEGEYDSWEEGDDEEEERNNKSSDVGLLAMDIGFTNYYSGNTFGTDAAPTNMEIRPARFGSHFALHFLPTTVSLLGKGTVNLKTALTFDYANYYFQNDITLVPEQEVFTIEDAATSLDKNKLTTRYFQVPLLLNINTAPWTDDGLSISVGVYGGVLWKAHTKQVSDELGKVKRVDDFNLNPIRYGLMARFDLKWLDIYATYNLTEMFEEGQGPSTQTFTVGLNLFDF